MYTDWLCPRFHTVGALAEFERDLIRERTTAGLIAARARGRSRCRPPVRAFRDPRKQAAAQWLYTEGKTTIGTICATFGISKSTFYGYVARDGAGDVAGGISGAGYDTQH